MGVLNVTPDSFSDGGDHATLGQAVARASALRRAGADLVDVGGESTRPGAGRVDETTERDRVLPVIAELSRGDIPCSVDTTRASVAADAVAAGAVLVNDVSGGLADPDMLAAVADAGVPFVATHWRGASADMQSKARYADVVAEVRDELADRLAACRRAGIRDVVLDPGLGFAKTADNNWALLQDLGALQRLGPLLIGASRKAFLGALLDGRGPKGRDAATTALTALVAAQGVWGVRVHDVAASADAVRVVERLGPPVSGARGSA